MIRVMHVLYTDNNYVAKDNFLFTMFETDNKSILLLLLLYTSPGSSVVHFLPRYHPSLY